MTICIAGKNNIAVDCLNFLLQFYSPKDICVVLNQTDNMRNTWQKSLGFYALKEGIEIKNLGEVQEISDLIFLSLEFDQIIKPHLFKSKKLFNIHFSLLPEYKGMYTSLLPVLHGRDKSGVTLHTIDQGIDTGDIIAQATVNIEGLNCEEVYREYLKAGTWLICENLQKIINNDFLLTPQPVLNSTYYSKKSINFKKREINPCQTAYQISQFVKAFNFRVYQLAEFCGDKIFSSRISHEKSSYKPGTILENDIEKIKISTIDYNIILFKDYYSDLIHYSELNDIEKANLIIDYVHNIDDLNNKGWNPLIVACYHGSKDVAKLLLEKGANPNAKNLNGTTVLMYAKEGYLKTGDPTIIHNLLNEGARTKDKDIFNKDIFDYINDHNLIELLNECNG